MSIVKNLLLEALVDRQNSVALSFEQNCELVDALHDVEEVLGLIRAYQDGKLNASDIERVLGE